jgi:membrane fusion protein (multidrug efflux system)
VDLSHASVERARVGLEAAEKEKGSQELALAAAESELRLAKTEHERTRHLVELGIVDRATLDRSTNTFRQAEIRVKAAAEAVARAEVGLRSAGVGVTEATAALALTQSGVEELAASIASLRVQLDKSRLRAPISGRLEEHLSEPGEMVSAGSPVARIYDLEHLKAVVHAPDRYIPFLDPGNRAAGQYARQNRPGAVREIRAVVVVPGLPKLTGGRDSGLELPASICRIAQAANSESNSFEVELRIANPSLALKHGVLAQGRIEYLTHPRAVLIPAKAIQATDAGPRVLVVERRDGKALARVRDVEPAAIREDEVLVLRGLEEGEDLIVAGWKGIVAGEEVNVVVENGSPASPGRLPARALQRP